MTTVDDRGVGVRVRVGENFSLFHVVHTGFRAHATSSARVTGTLSPGVKRPGRDADHSPPTMQRSKNMCLYIHFPIGPHGVVLT
jgi:hypothetical protein